MRALSKTKNKSHSKKVLYSNKNIDVSDNEIELHQEILTTPITKTTPTHLIQNDIDEVSSTSSNSRNQDIIAPKNSVNQTKEYFSNENEMISSTQSADTHNKSPRKSERQPSPLKTKKPKTTKTKAQKPKNVKSLETNNEKTLNNENESQVRRSNRRPKPPTTYWCNEKIPIVYEDIFETYLREQSEKKEKKKLKLFNDLKNKTDSSKTLSKRGAKKKNIDNSQNKRLPVIVEEYNRENIIKEHMPPPELPSEKSKKRMNEQSEPTDNRAKTPSEVTTQQAESIVSETGSGQSISENVSGSISILQLLKDLKCGNRLHTSNSSLHSVCKLTDFLNLNNT